MTEPKPLSPEEKALWRKHPATMPPGFDRVWATLDAAEARIAELKAELDIARSRCATLDRELDKAARIAFVANQEAVKYMIERDALREQVQTKQARIAELERRLDETTEDANAALRGKAAK
jgi:predicted RNase H-like nuclease (RuvC/YqgF family)